MTLMKTAFLTLAVAGCFATGRADAGQVDYMMIANAPARCQAFTPGPANTIRNRVVGSENVGALMNVSCTFEKVWSAQSTNVTSVSLWFSNNGAGTVAVNCTMLTGYQGQSGAIVLNKSVNVTHGSQEPITFSYNDTENPSDTDLGNNIVGVNCALPTGAVINDTYIQWKDENGI